MPANPMLSSSPTTSLGTTFAKLSYNPLQINHRRSVVKKLGSSNIPLALHSVKMNSYLIPTANSSKSMLTKVTRPTHWSLMQTMQKTFLVKIARFEWLIGPKFTNSLQSRYKFTHTFIQIYHNTFK